MNDPRVFMIGFFKRLGILFLITLPVAGAPAWGADQQPPFNPPWGETRERVPQEVKDKENETPLAWCGTDPNQFEVTYLDGNTGTRTTIRRRVVTLPDGKTTKIVWEVNTQEPGQPRKKVTLDLEPGNETRTERVGREPPKTRPVREGDLHDPTKETKKQSYFLSPFDSSTMARLVYPSASPLKTNLPESRYAQVDVSKSSVGSTISEEALSRLPRARGQTPPWLLNPRQDGSSLGTINLNVATYGARPNTLMGFRGEPPRLSVDQFVLGDLADELWEAWKESTVPVVMMPGDVVDTYLRGPIEIVGDWSLGMTDEGMLFACTGLDAEDYDEEGVGVSWQGRTKLMIQ